MTGAKKDTAGDLETLVNSVTNSVNFVGSVSAFQSETTRDTPILEQVVFLTGRREGERTP